jgi:hypothetical protein
MERVEVFETTDPATVTALASSPDVDLEISNLYPRYPRPPYTYCISRRNFFGGKQLRAL